jgi:hypothetical protein
MRPAASGWWLWHRALDPDTRMDRRDSSETLPMSVENVMSPRRRARPGATALAVRGDDLRIVFHVPVHGCDVFDRKVAPIAIAPPRSSG